MILDQIIARTKERLNLRMSITPRNEMERRARAAATPKKFFDSVRRATGSPIRIVPEFRRVQYLRGPIRPDFNLAQFSKDCETGKAAALSICTEEENFRGLPTDLSSVRSSCNLPLLRNDYILDRYQLFESRALGADAVLLQAFLHDRSKLRDLLTCIGDLGMEGVFEVSEERELATVLPIGAKILRLSNRDPRSFRNIPGKVDKLRHLIPAGIAVIFDGDSTTTQDLQRWRRENIDALILSESILNSPDPVAKLRELA